MGRRVVALIGTGLVAAVVWAGRGAAERRGAEPRAAERAADIARRAARPAGAAPDGEAVLASYCSGCHGGPGAAKGGGDADKGDFAWVTETPRLIATGMLVPGDAEGSLVYKRVAAGEMPPKKAPRRPAAAEIETLRAWIDTMSPPAPFVTDLEVDRELTADRDALSAGDREQARWISFVPLANAGIPEAQLEAYRAALAKLLGSLSWSPALHPPAPVDARRLLYRIDLRDLGWSAATWDAILAVYPYGVDRGRAPAAVRGDWLVATASRPPLYQEILGLPDTDAALGRLLGIDLADDVASGRVARAGFTSSGISVNNRLIERHVTRHGALWRSYDFSSSVGRENVFAHPLDFVPAGGEIIFNLPNGLQGYMLVDGAGRRIDKAPTRIVSDPARPDRAVETGVSCMSCHAHGIIQRADEIRAAVAAGASDAGSLAAGDRARVLRLHPPADDFAALQAEDIARFDAALAELGVDQAAEPIALLVARYEAPLDEGLAAAELGLTAEELRARLRRADETAQQLGALATGGTVKRDVWEASFPRLVVELGVGIPARPPAGAAGAAATTVVWIDDDGNSWFDASVSATQAEAVSACRALRLESPTQTALVQAVSNGFAGVLGDAGRTFWTSGTRLDLHNQRYGFVVESPPATARRAAAGERHGVICVSPFADP